MVRLSSRATLAFAVVIAALLGGMAFALAESRDRSREDLEARLGQRATVAAALIETTFKTTIEQTRQQTAQLSGRTLTAEDLKEVVGGFGGIRTTVLDARRRVLAAWPAGAPMAATSGVGPALAGSRPSLQVRAGASPSIDLVIGYDTPYGRRASITAYPVMMIAGFLTTYLNRISAGNSDAAYVIDPKSGVVLGQSSHGEDLEPPLPTAREGVLDLDGKRAHYEATDIGGTSWRLVVAVPEEQLFAPINGASRWLPWVIFAGFALSAGFALALLVRISRDAARLHAANEELGRRNAEVLAATQMKSDFLATMSHELRTPLNAIIGFAELMHDERIGPVSADHKELLGDILGSSDHLRRLIDDVLDLSKVEAGKLDLRFEPIDAGELTAACCDLVSGLAAARGITLRHEADPAVGVVETDPDKLRQVVLNYLSNAVKFAPEDGHVSVRVRPDGDDRFRVEVEDDGPGIAPEDRDRAWRAFEQLASGSARPHGGTGLGLALTRRLVEAQGGTVGLDRAPGGGALFWASLPTRARVREEVAA